MLDSTGIHGHVNVGCVFCPSSLDLRIYTPQYGHAGEVLTDSGTYFDYHSFGPEESTYKTFVRGKLFTLQFNGENLVIDEVRLYAAADPYAYANPICPNFGLGTGKVFWVCSHCLEILNSDKDRVHESLSNKAKFFGEAERTIRKERTRNLRKMKVSALA